MSTPKIRQILLYCHFNKTIQGPGTRFQYPALNPKHVINMCHTAHQYLTKFHVDSTQDSKEMSMSNFHYVAMPMMMSQILKSVDFTQTRKSRYLENETLFSQNSIVAEVTFKAQDPRKF